jgi:hypothetical protein
MAAAMRAVAPRASCTRTQLRLVVPASCPLIHATGEDCRGCEDAADDNGEREEQRRACAPQAIQIASQSPNIALTSSARQSFPHLTWGNFGAIPFAA